MKIRNWAMGIALWLGLSSALAVAQGYSSYGYRAQQPYYPPMATPSNVYGYHIYAYNGYAYNGYIDNGNASSAAYAASGQSPANTFPGEVQPPVTTTLPGQNLVCGPQDFATIADDTPWTLPQPGIFQQYGIRLGGWVDSGISWVANNPVDRYNGVVTFNDRDGEGQMNQLWFFLERPTAACNCGWDIGGRIDVLYGTDARFTQAVDGLEESWDQRERFYQTALPQFYVDVAYNDWILRAGHFFTILGYEVVPATGNFFYSHSYTMQYGEPFTHTGFLLTRKLGEQWKITAGLHRGNDQFDDTDGLDAWNFLGGVTWTGAEDWASAAFALSATEQGPGIHQQIYSLVGTLRLTDRWKYVLQHDYGQTFDRNTALKADWYGVNQYLFYEINKCWGAGLRMEWFRDEDGTRVTGLGAGNLAQGPFAGDFYEITAGLNWKPHANITVRPEVRWDWFDPRGSTSNHPYDSGDRNSQFLFGCDLIATY